MVSDIYAILKSIDEKSNVIIKKETTALLDTVITKGIVSEIYRKMQTII